MKNKQEKMKNAFNGVFSSELKPISSYQVEEYQPIETKKEEVQIKEEKKEIVKQEKIETKKEISKKEKQETTRKTFKFKSSCYGRWWSWFWRNYESSCSWCWAN